MIPLGELRVEAIRENLRTISYFVHGIARRLEMTEKTLFDIELALEEAAINIVNHAYRPDQSGDILVRVEMAGDLVYIAPTRVNLDMTMERWPDIVFLATREHGVYDV